MWDPLSASRYELRGTQHVGNQYTQPDPTVTLSISWTLTAHYLNHRPEPVLPASGSRKQTSKRPRTGTYRFYFF